MHEIEPKYLFRNREKLPDEVYLPLKEEAQRIDKKRTQEVMKAKQMVIDGMFDNCQRVVVEHVARKIHVAAKNEEAARRAEEDAAYRAKVLGGTAPKASGQEEQAKQKALDEAKMWKAAMDAPPPPGRSLADDLGAGVQKMVADAKKGKFPNVWGGSPVVPPVGAPQRGMGAPVRMFKPI